MRTVKFEEFERRLEQRKARLGYEGRDFVSPNSGVARTPEKRNFLARMFARLKGEGRTSPFNANY